MATGETGHFPSIHIWNSDSIECSHLLTTQHPGGVLEIAFSHDHLISLGYDAQYTLEIFNWPTERSLSFRRMDWPIFGMAPNPVDASAFVTCGADNVSFWKQQGQSLQRNVIVKKS